MDESKESEGSEHRITKGKPNNRKGNTKTRRKEAPKISEIRLDDWQKEFLATQGDKILCTGRQVGKSVICAMDASEWAVKNKDTIVLMIAPTERQSYALFGKTLNYLVTHYPNRIEKKGKLRPTKERINLTNGVKIYCLPTGMSGLGIRFLTVGRLYVDEASRVPEDVWNAVTPMLLTTGGDSIYLSTPFGQQGEFYRCWVNEDSAYDSFTRFSTDSEVVMANRPICETWTEKTREKALQKIEQAKARMSKREYAQEYLGQFIDDLHRFFSDALIKEICILKRSQFRKPNGIFFCGCDIARLGEDEGTYEILEKLNDEAIYQRDNIVTTKKLTTETFDRIVQLETVYGFKKIGIDAGSGSLGVGILDFLLREPSVRRKVVALNSRSRELDYRGEKKRTLLKEDMYQNLLAMMEKRILKLLDDDDIIASLKSIQYEYLKEKGQFTKIRIFGDYAHITDGIIRAAWLANQKHLNSSISWI